MPGVIQMIHDQYDSNRWVLGVLCGGFLVFGFVGWFVVGYFSI